MTPLSIELTAYPDFIHVHVTGTLTLQTVRDFYATLSKDRPAADIPRLIDFRAITDYDIGFLEAGVFFDVALKALRADQSTRLRRVFLAEDKWIYANLRLVATRSEVIENYEVTLAQSEGEALEQLGYDPGLRLRDIPRADTGA